MDKLLWIYGITRCVYESHTVKILICGGQFSHFIDGKVMNFFIAHTFQDISYFISILNMYLSVSFHHIHKTNSNFLHKGPRTKCERYQQIGCGDDWTGRYQTTTIQKYMMLNSNIKPYKQKPYSICIPKIICVTSFKTS